ncbi:MAG: long-chain-fatty-acid--CoA ligase [Candidatus Promineifilaceae bacterium]|jgi:long-chain acyl-CoA synthetase
MSIKYSDKPWLNFYEDGVPSTVEVPDETLLHLLEKTCDKYPEQTAILFKGREIKYCDLQFLVDTLAAALAANGFKKGDRAALFMVNIPQFIIAFFAILKAGGIVVSTNPLYSERELEHQLIDCGAETVFVMSLYYKTLKNVQQRGLTKVKRVIVTNIKEYLPTHLRVLFTVVKERKDGHHVDLHPGDMWFQDLLASGERAPLVDTKISPDDVAILQYTGGTTGVAKGAVALHRNLVANTYQCQAWITDVLEGGETVLLAIPLFHTFGLVAGLCFGMSIGARLILIPDPRDQEDVLDNIKKYKPSVFPGVPAMYVAINNNPRVQENDCDIKSIRICISGSAPLMLETKIRFEELTGAKLVEGYGLTEANVVTHGNPIHGTYKEGSIGLPFPNVECRIMDQVTGEQEMPVDECGELVIRSPSIMQGYWQLPTETSNALRDGWLYTGDIARMDEDGYFFIEDRKKDMIIASGFNIYPREVEEVLLTHPSVLEVAVAGVPDPKRGETVKAWIVKRANDDIDERAIIDWSKERLAKYKYPRQIEFLDELPRTSVGKVLKRELVKEALEATQNDG